MRADAAVGEGVDPWDTGFVDLAGSQGLLGQRDGRTGAAVIDWLRERTPQFRDAIEFVAIDPAAVYASAIRTPGLLPNAQIVVDQFHLVKLGNERCPRCAAASPGNCATTGAASSIRSEPTGVGCCGRGNVCRRAASPECGTSSSTRIPVRGSCPRGSPKKNRAPCYSPCAPAAAPTSPAVACIDS